MTKLVEWVGGVTAIITCIVGSSKSLSFSSMLHDLKTYNMWNSSIIDSLNSTSDASEVFQSEKSDDSNEKLSDFKKKEPGHCLEGSLYNGLCLHDQNYDEEIENLFIQAINTTIAEDGFLWNVLFSNDSLDEEIDSFYDPDADVISTRTGDFGLQETPACKSQSKVLCPKSGITKNNVRKFILNQDKYKQCVRVHLCISEDDACSLNEHFGYPAKHFICKQNYVWKTMVTSDGSKVGADSILFESCCSCVIKDDAMIRVAPKRSKLKNMTSRSVQAKSGLTSNKGSNIIHGENGIKEQKRRDKKPPKSLRPIIFF